MSISHQAKKKCQWLILQGNDKVIKVAILEKINNANYLTDLKAVTKSKGAFVQVVGAKRHRLFTSTPFSPEDQLNEGNWMKE